MKIIPAFFTDVIEEMKKVTWPTKDEAIKMTITVIIATVIVGIYVGGLDYALTKAIEQLIK